MALLGLSPFGISLAEPTLAVMPVPRQIRLGTGDLAIGRKFKIVLASKDPVVRAAAERCLRSLQKSTGVTFAPGAVTQASASSQAALLIVVREPATMRMGLDESYTLTIGANGAHLEASNSIGAVRGLATVRQLIATDKQHAYLPAVTIADGSRFAWRGLMIDVSRHFIPLDGLKRNIDAMEAVKLNVLHLHLSDNEGFRVESKVFPKLYEDGSKGEFYTQVEMRGLIQYAAERGIVIIPEFDMPSHSKSWLAGYPELSSSPGPFKPGTLHYTGVNAKSTLAELMAASMTDKIPALDPSRESTYEFLDKLIGEMTELFPAPYFHVGADENNGAVWLANPAIVAFMKEHNFADAPTLQAYFVARVQSLVEKHGKKMVAWEEGFVPGVSKNTVFQAWVADPKTDILNSPKGGDNQFLISRGFYLDLFYPAQVHYLNDTIPTHADNSLLGGEAPMWTEIEDRANIESRIWPRAGAIAERLWSPAEVRDVPDMYRRLFVLSAQLDREGAHNLSNYELQTSKLAGNLPVEPVRTLLDVLVPVKGYKLVFSVMLNPAIDRDAGLPLDSVADIVLVDSATKHAFRTALASYLQKRDAGSEELLRAQLLRWSRNGRQLAPYCAQSGELGKVCGHAQRLSALADAGLQALDRIKRGEVTSESQRSEGEALLMAAKVSEAGTEIAVLPELEGLLDAKLAEEPNIYPLF
jgi:hexosaminidase